jgi:hypothetical protein
MQHPIKVMLVQEIFTAHTPQTVQVTSPTTTALQTQAKTIMQGTATTTTLPHITLATTTLDTDITPTQHHTTPETTMLDMDITLGTQDITLVHILNQQEPHLQMLGPGHPQQTQPTYIMGPTQQHTHLFTTPDTSHFRQQTILRAVPAPTL